MKLKFFKAVLISAVMATATIVSSCNNSSESVSVYNWGDFLDESLLSDFTAETGIAVSYQTYASNEDLFTRLRNNASNYDVAVPSDYTIQRMINEDMLQEINFDNIPNYSNIAERFKSLPYDPEAKYSVPYMWGTVGILYNTTMVDDPVESFDILWDEKYRGQIFMYDSMRDSLGVSLKRLGYSWNSKNIDELNHARDELIKQKPLVQAYFGDPVKDKMIGNEGALAIVYSGDAMYAMSLNEDLAFALPREGSNLWYDSMVIPKGAENKEAAEKFINFMNDPEIALQNSEYIGYSSTNLAAVALMPEETTNNFVYWPSEELIEGFEVSIDLGDFLSEYDRAWTEVLTSN